MAEKRAVIYHLIIYIFICAINLVVASTANSVIAELRKAGTTKTKFSTSVGNIVDVDIYINTMGNQIGGVYIYLSFDNKIFELVDLTQPVAGGPFLNNWQLMENDTHGDPGNAIPKFQIDYAKATFAPENAKVGDGVIGTFHLKALKPVVSTQITFDKSKFHNRETQCARGAGLKIVEFTNLTPATISVKGALKIKPIGDIVFNVGESYEIDLDDYIDEPAIPDSEIAWTVSGNKNIEAIIAPNSHVATFSSQDWTGEESMVFTAEAASGESAVMDATVKVVAPPVFSELPAVKFKATEKSRRLNLNKHLTDFDDPNLEGIQWDYRNATNIKVELSSEGFVTFSSRRGWADTEEIIIIATDSDGNVAEAPIKVTVIAAPVVSNLPDVTSTIDGSISKPRLVLDDYVSDSDNNPDELIWSFSGNNNIEVIIDNATHEVIFRSDNPLAPFGKGDWTGAEEITFTATDPDLQSGSDTLMVRLISAENGLVVLDIPDISFSEWDAPPTLDLNEYVIDLDGSPDEITWTYKGNDKIFISIDPNNIATFSADEMAEELITFTATDADVNRASDQMTATYIANQPPEIAPLPEQVLQGGAPSKIFNLDDFVSDDNTPKDEIKWSASGYDEAHLIVVIEVSRNVLVIPAKDWYGAEVATFTASDAQGNEASKQCLIKVTAAPVVTLSGEIKVAEGETDTSLNLDEYVEDADTPKEQISWEARTTPLPPVAEVAKLLGKGEQDETKPLPLMITVDSVSRKVVIYASTGSEGDYAVTFIATDPDGNEGEGTINVKVTKYAEEEKPPVVEDIPDVILSAGKPSATINLNDYVHDADTPPEEIAWSASGNSKINVDINDENKAILTFQEGFSGTEKITFTATDTDSSSDNDDVNVTVSKSLPPHFVSPSLKPLPEVVDGRWKMADGDNPPAPFGKGEASELNLDDYVEDEDTPFDELEWQVGDYNQKYMVVKISPQHKVTITAVKDWHGVEEITFTVTDPDGNQASASTQVKFTAPPKVSLPSVLSLAEGEKNTSLNLDDHVTDKDTPLNELNWQAHPGSEKIDVQIDKSHKVTISALEGSVGEHNVSFIATDSDGNSGSGTVVVKVTSEKDLEAPTFTIAVLPNPIQPNYITITVYSSEELNAAPILTIDEAKVPLTEVGTNLWRGTHILPIEAKNKAIISVLGTDLAGNEGASMKAFTVIQPSPKALTYLKLKSYPNPAVGVDEVIISCNVDAPVSIRLRIYNLAGKLVKTIEVDPLALDSKSLPSSFRLSSPERTYRNQAKGYEYHWDMRDSSGESIASGIYFCYAEAVDHDFRITTSWKLAVVR